MHENTERTLTRDCEAIRIPSGETFTITEGTQVYITQALGGSYTVATNPGLARIVDANADALGIEPTEATSSTSDADDVPVDEKAVWDQLKTCYDPEIPVNIVDLGLVYDCIVTPRESGGGSRGRCENDADRARLRHGADDRCGSESQKVMSVPGVRDADVELVWDPRGIRR